MTEAPPIHYVCNRKRFNTFELALAHAARIFDRTGVVVEVKAVQPLLRRKRVDSP